MIREERYVHSHKPYAVRLDSLDVGDKSYHTVEAIWFRGTVGEPVAVYGKLWDVQTEVPADVHEFLARHDDGRYGGDAKARWDGVTLWAPNTEFYTACERHRLLEVALANYPAVPSGYDGWWTFEDDRRRHRAFLNRLKEKNT